MTSLPTNLSHQRIDNSRPNLRALHLIALFEALKGILAIAGATGLAFFGPNPIRHWISLIIQHLQLDPDHGALPSLLKMLVPSLLHLATVVLVFYALIRFLETWGLWRARTWASTLGVISACLYLPLDIYGVIKHPGWIAWAVILINLCVIIYLLYDLRSRKRALKL